MISLPAVELFIENTTPTAGGGVCGAAVPAAIAQTTSAETVRAGNFMAEPFRKRDVMPPTGRRSVLGILMHCLEANVRLSRGFACVVQLPGRSAVAREKRPVDAGASRRRTGGLAGAASLRRAAAMDRPVVRRHAGVVGTLRYGTCSWSDKAWVGAFYPAGTKPAEYLRHYATHFDTVEADSTYYASPPAERVRRWAEDTPPGFVISSKLPRDCFLGGDAREMVPGLVLHTPAFEEPLQRHAAVMQQLGAKRGPTVIQCPWFQPGYFRDVHDFLARLD